MKQTKVTIRYAKALLQLSIEQKTLEDAYNDMVFINSLCSHCNDFSILLKSPIVKTDHKLRIFDEIFASKISKISMMFVSIITTKKRESFLQEVAKSFIALYKKYKNIQTATVTTAIPLTEELKNEVLDFIKSDTKNKVELTEVVDKNIIGGAIVRVGDKQLDASVANEILELRQMFNNNLYIKDF